MRDFRFSQIKESQERESYNTQFEYSYIKE